MKGFDSFGDGGVVITGPVAVGFARLLVLRSALKLELLGMRRSGRSVSAVLRSEFGWTGSRARLAELLNAHIEAERARIEAAERGE